jgi:hypothetical protein
VDVVEVVDVPDTPVEPMAPPVEEVSVELMVPLIAVSVELGAVVLDAVSLMVEVVELIDVSETAVSVLALSSFLQPKARMATAARAMRVMAKDFFICFSLKYADPVRIRSLIAMIVERLSSFSGCPNHLTFAYGTRKQMCSAPFGSAFRLE